MSGFFWRIGRPACDPRGMMPALPKELTAPLRAFLGLLDRWNRTHSLTALPAGARWEELVLDAAALLPHLSALQPGSVVADLGTGMGSPAMILALARPDLRILGVDSAGKKLAFLRQAALELGVKNLQTVHGRFETLPPLGADLGVAKALADLDQLATWWRRLGKPGTSLLALKGPEWVTEPRPTGWTLAEHPYELPTRGRRAIVELRPA